MIKCYLPRATGNQWEIQKFHDLLHLVEDMERFGSSKNFDAGPLESALRFWAKFPARTAQTRGYNTFGHQVCQRIYEYLVLAKARRVYGVVGIRDGHLPDLDSNLRDKKRTREDYEEAGEEESGDASTTGASTTERCRVQYPLQNVTTYHVNPTFAVGAVYPFSGKEQFRQGYSALPTLVVDYLQKQHTEFLEASEDTRKGLEAKWVRPTKGQNGDSYFEVRTELTFGLLNKDRHRRTNSNIRMRCHTNYRSQGEWYDWVVVDYEEDGPGGRSGPANKKAAVPCKLLAFVFDQGAYDGEGAWKAVLHPCSFQDKQDQDQSGLFFQQWKLNYTPKNKNDNNLLIPELDVVELETIIDRCLVVEQIPGIKAEIDPRKSVPKMDTSRKVVYILPRRLWGDKFV